VIQDIFFLVPNKDEVWVYEMIPHSEDNLHRGSLFVLDGISEFKHDEYGKNQSSRTFYILLT
jgi:hypothetical protein